MNEPPAASGSAEVVPVWTSPTPIAMTTVPTSQLQTWTWARLSRSSAGYRR